MAVLLRLRDREMWIGDVESSCYEELDVLPAGRKGADLGFPKFESFHAFTEEQADDSTFAVHTTPTGTIPGVRRHRRRREPRLGRPGAGPCVPVRRLLRRAGVWLRRSAGGVEIGTVGVSAPRVQSFARDLAGRIYVLSAEQGLLRLDPP